MSAMWRSGFRLPRAAALLGMVAVSLATAGCLPDEEETLGDQPEGAALRYTFDSGIPGAFSGSSLFTIIPDASQGGGISGPPSLYSGSYGTSAGDTSCISMSIAISPTRIRYYRRVVLVSTVVYNVTVQPSGTPLETLSIGQSIGWADAEFSLPAGTNLIDWCFSTPTPAVGGSGLWLDDIRLFVN